ncbi:unnamed protein product [Caenorhabditis sp. 36 PRJEB53466]|nr:unnamed protein product [Caenorhabditis sp. 36 PRJEB53466]
MPPGKKDQCKACGGYEFALNDGFMYCERCGALLENFEEMEEEEGGINHTIGKGKINIKKKTEDGESGKKEKRKTMLPPKLSGGKRIEIALEKRAEFLKAQAVHKENLPFDQTPDYLHGIGVRLFAFTQILSKSIYILVQELGFEASLQKNALAVFQKYLAHCKVAFCADEQCGNDEQLRFVAIMENIHYEEEARAEKRRKKLEKRGKGVRALSKSAAAWQLLTQGNLTENLELVSEEEEEEEEDEEQRGEEAEDDADDEDPEETVAVNDTTMGFLRKVTTALSKEALRRASQIVINLEVLVAIVHSAMLCSGYQNVFVSDIVRWIREDRFRISLKAIKSLNRGFIDFKKPTVEESNTAVFTAEHFLKFPLYEIVRTSTLFHQSLRLEKNMAPNSFEKLAARLIDNLNLPVDILSRVLLLESIVPCDLSLMLQKQVDVRMGKDFEQLTGTVPKLNNEAFMTCFGRKDMYGVETKSDEVILCNDSKVLAYILLALKLTFNLDTARCSSSTHANDNQFDIDTWIHQLEMRIKCWQGHDMSMVLRTTCPIPEIHMQTPLGPDHLIFARDSLPFAVRHRRQIGFRDCIPSEMSFHSTSNLPTVFDVRSHRFQKDRRKSEATLAPLKFQTTVLRKEMEMNSEKFENIDEDSEKTFFKDFTNFKTTEMAESFDELFPCASSYSQYPRPDWISYCTARKSKLTPKTGPLRFLLSREACDDLLNVAAFGFSDRFRFLLSSFSLLIGEDQMAVYAAFVMLEMHLTGGSKLEKLREDLVKSTPIRINGQTYSSSSFHPKFKQGIITDSPIHSINQLRWFKLTEKFFDQEEDLQAEEAAYLQETRNHGIRRLGKEQEEIAKKYDINACFEFETFFQILAIKFW